MADNGVIAVSVTAVIAGPITISRVAIAITGIAIGRSVSVTVAVSGVAIAIIRITVAVG
jgi:hypothetical protein